MSKEYEKIEAKLLKKIDYRDAKVKDDIIFIKKDVSRIRSN